MYVVFQELPVTPGHQVGGKADLVHVAETQGPDHPDDGLGGTLLELGGETRGDDGGNGGVASEKGLHVMGPVEHLLGTLAAHAGAVSAPDAPFGDHAGLALGNAYGLGGAFAHARVARGSAP